LSDDLLTVSALELAARIRSGDASAVEVVAAHIDRCRVVNPVINAIVADRFADAHKQALEVDALRRAGAALPPLAGVPFTVKEMIDWAGMPSTFGCTARRARRADRDATIVQRMRAAGAIPIASTNVPEWGLWYETSNLIYGRTNNPHDTTRTTGGSSGGEAAIVASGGSAFGLGSDIGGSIRIPASFCGVYGHKPTNGLLPLTGHYPVYQSGLDARVPTRNPWVVVGPLARSARDLLPILRICAGVDATDPNADAIELSTAAVNWDRRAVYVLEDPGIRFAGRPESQMRAAVRRAARAFERAGAIMREGPAELFRDIVDLWFCALESIGDRPMTELLAEHNRISLAREIGALAVGRARYTVPALGFALVEKLFSRSRARIAAQLEHIAQLQKQFQERIGDGILLLPPHPRPAPKHVHPLLHPFAFAYTAAFNVLRVPATVAPVATSDHGLPIAVQIVSTRGNDHITIAAACVLEDELGTVRLPELAPVSASAHTQPH
jgi:fatty acid amide hydrolase 2